MSKVLYIKANPKTEENSYTFKMSEAFIDEYKKSNPEDEIITLDLYNEEIKFLDSKDLEEMFSGKNTRMHDYAKQFAGVDKYVIAAPMWNLGSPAILKAYFDYVMMVGVTFKYTAEGPVGLLANQGKKAVHITARGGKYSEGDGAQYEMGDRYIRIVMGFMGIYDITTVPVENTNVLTGDELNKAVSEATQNARSLAKTF